MTRLTKTARSPKASPIGLIPPSWDVAPMKELAEFSNGLNFLSSDHGENYRIIGVSGFQNYFYPQPDSFEQVEVSENLPSNAFLKENDLLFVRSNGNKALIGRCLFIRNLSEPTTFSGFTIRARILSDRILPMFCAIFFRSAVAKAQIQLLGGGTNISNLSQKILGSILIPVPPLCEQERIVNAFSAWESSIEITNKAVASKKRFKETVMHHLLTGRIRFPGFGAAIESSGQLPQGWRRCRLGEIFCERTESNPSLPLLSITAELGVIPRNEIERKDTSNSDKSKYKRIAPGDIGYNTMRMWQGVSAVSSLEGIVSPAYTICVPLNNQLPEYFGYLFKYPPMIHRFYRYSQGLVDDTLNLKFHHFSLISVDVPTLQEQRKIAYVLSKIDQEIFSLSQLSKRLQMQKDGLMQKLLTGKIQWKG